MRTFNKLVLGLLVIGVASAVVLKRNPFKRLIPADTLRDFPGHCFASTLCKVIKPGETWSLSPFCGQSECKAILNKNNQTVYGEEVTDCGPLLDLEKSVGCTLLKDQVDKEAAFPDCCPLYECPEGAQVFYVNPPKAKSPRKTE